MGWASGSRIAEELWKELKPYTSQSNHKEVSKILIDKFCEYDADDWECYPSDDCLYYVYLKYNEPKELEEYDFGY